MIFRHNQAQIQEYQDRPEMNNSSIKAIIQRGIQAFLKDQQELLHTDEDYLDEREHFTIGKAVDTLISEGREAFNEQYHFINLQQKPAEKPAIIVRMLYEKLIVRGEPAILENPAEGISFEEYPISAFKRDLYDLCNIVVDSKGSLGYYLNNKIPSDKLVKGKIDERDWTEDKRVDRLLGDGLCEQYWKELLQAKGKKILTEEQYNCIMGVYNSFVGHEFTAYLFDETEYLKEERDLDIIYQLPIYWSQPIEIITDEGVKVMNQDCRGLIDTLIVNHTKKWLVPLDEKTTRYPILQFHHQIEARRYDVQASFYTTGINSKEGREIISNLIGVDVSDYKIQNFAFVAESTVYTGTPMIFPLTDKLLEVGWKGNDEKKGWLQGLQEYKAFEHYGFSVANMVAKYNGVSFVDENFDLLESDKL